MLSVTSLKNFSPAGHTALASLLPHFLERRPCLTGPLAGAIHHNCWCHCTAETFRNRANLPRVLYWLEFTERESSVDGEQSASRVGSSGGKRAVPLSGSSIHSSMYASQELQAMWLYLMILCWSHLLGMRVQCTWHVCAVLEGK